MTPYRSLPSGDATGCVRFDEFDDCCEADGEVGGRKIGVRVVITAEFNLPHNSRLLSKKAPGEG
jgi:hypothetical protein